MNTEYSDVYGLFRNFPPLYTEQINEVTLSKQLEIWEIFIRQQFDSGTLFVLNEGAVEFYPFNNSAINRKVSRQFLTLIAQHMVERGYGFYMHIMTKFCEDNDCTIWGALFSSGTPKTNKVRSLHDEECRRINACVKQNKSLMDTLKEKRKVLEKKQVSVGIFGKTIAESMQDMLRYLRGQLPSNHLETPYHLFYGDSASSKRYKSWPEEHIAILLATLAMHNRISLIPNDAVPIRTLNNKQLGIQLV